MAKLQKARPALKETRKNPTWWGAKLDTVRVKFYVNTDSQKQKTKPKVKSSRKHTTISWFRAFLYSKEPIIQELDAVTTTDISDHTTPQVHDVVCTTESNDVSQKPENVNETTQEEALDSHELSFGNSDQEKSSHEYQHIDQEYCDRETQTLPADALFTQEEVIFKLETALRENNLFWEFRMEREKAKASRSVSPEQLDELVSSAIEKSNARLLLRLDNLKKQQDREHVERVRTSLLNKAATQPGTSAAEETAETAQQACDVKAKKALMIVSSRFHQLLKSKLVKDLADAKESICDLERELLGKHEDLVEMTTQASRYRSFLQFSYETTRQSFDEWYAIMTQKQNYANGLEQQLREKGAELAKMTEKYADIQQRHSNIVAEHTEREARLEDNIDELQRELESVRSTQQQLFVTPTKPSNDGAESSRTPFTWPKPSYSSTGNVNDTTEKPSGIRNTPTPAQPFSFGQPMNTSLGDYPQPPSQKQFTSQVPPTFFLSDNPSSMAGTIFNGLPNPSPYSPPDAGYDQAHAADQPSEESSNTQQNPSRQPTPASQEAGFQRFVDRQNKAGEDNSSFEDELYDEAGEIR